MHHICFQLTLYRSALRPTFAFARAVLLFPVQALLDEASPIHAFTHARTINVSGTYGVGGMPTQ